VLFTSSSTHMTGRGMPAGAAARRSALAAWTRLVLRFRWLVLAGWLVVLAGGAVALTSLPGHLANSYSVPATDSARAASLLAREFGERPDGTFTVVFRVPSTDRRTQAALHRRLVAAAHTLPDGHLGVFRAGFGVVFGEIGTSLGLQQAKGATEPLRATLAAQPGPRALVTGEPAVQHDLDPRLAADARRGELLALPVALVVLAFVLGLSLALLTPFVFAAFTIAGTLLLLDVAARFFAISPYAVNLVELIGLGLAIDYSLLVVTRYREEVRRGRAREDAVAATMATAGRAVVFSGLAVAVGLALLLVVPVPFIRTLGLGGLLIPLVSVAGALTLQPVLLSFLGAPAVVRRPRVPWARLAQAIARRPVTVAVLASAVLVAAALPALSLQVTPGSLDSLPRSMESQRGLVTLRQAFGPGALTPTEVVVRGGANRVADRIVRDPEAYVVALGPSAPYVSSDGRYDRIFVVGRHAFGDPASQALVHRLRDRLGPSASIGGAAPQGVDFLSRAYGAFPWLVLLALALTYAVLAAAFRSLVLPLKAIVLNALVVSASYGLLVLVFGPQIDGWIPIFLFATLFGLSMDYEVFLVSRMREAHDAGANDAAAIATGLEKTGGLITAAALVMAASFAGFVAGSVPALQQFGLGLALAVLIDATLVRVLLVPAAMTILGRWNWWLPRRPERLRAAEATR
jgi:RND superfamily putative drug exporter